MHSESPERRPLSDRDLPSLELAYGHRPRTVPGPAGISLLAPMLPSGSQVAPSLLHPATPPRASSPFPRPRSCGGGTRSRGRPPGSSPRYTPVDMATVALAADQYRSSRAVSEVSDSRPGSALKSARRTPTRRWVGSVDDHQDFDGRVCASDSFLVQCLSDLRVDRSKFVSYGDAAGSCWALPPAPI